MTVTAREGSRDDAIIEAYLAGKKIASIEHEFGVGRSTIYHVLRRSGQVPARSQRRIEGASKDAALAGLYELIRHQDRTIEDLEARIEPLVAEINRLRRKLHRAGLDDGDNAARRSKSDAARRRSQTDAPGAASKRHKAG